MSAKPESWTSIVVTCPDAEQLVARWRRAFDPATRRGMPAHMTLLAPFVAAEEMTESDHAGVMEVWTEHAPLQAVLTHVEQLPGAIVLRPDTRTEETLSQVTFALLRRWRHLRGVVRTGFSRPYHLTVACRDDDALRAAIDSDLSQHLPLCTVLETMTVFAATAVGDIRRLAEIGSGS